MARFDIENLRAVEWGKKHLWDIRFVGRGTPDGFTEWFPASDVDVTEASVESFEFNTALNTHSVPRSARHQQISVTFYDNDNGDLFAWLREWMREGILNKGLYISTVGKACRLLQVQKINTRHEPTTDGLEEYNVYPDGDLVFNGSSSSEAQSYTQRFVVAGSGGGLHAL